MSFPLRSSSGVEARSPAEQMALRLAAVLKRDHAITAEVHCFHPSEAVISIWFGLLARANGQLIRWVIPDSTRDRGKPLWTYASSPDSAAVRLAEHYRELCGRAPIDAALAGSLLVDVLLEHHDHPVG
ncbi:hypothetical protein ACQPYK_08485 [Streptosporangium sp. CA-135522]|uniref:hypothetical protein n=1 Tax=Streptosporangium sp. CA-135522 TaxID=3240072 RepID=UPI003D8A2EEA